MYNDDNNSEEYIKNHLLTKHQESAALLCEIECYSIDYEVLYCYSIFTLMKYLFAFSENGEKILCYPLDELKHYSII